MRLACGDFDPRVIGPKIPDSKIKGLSLLMYRCGQAKQRLSTIILLPGASALSDRIPHAGHSSFAHSPAVLSSRLIPDSHWVPELSTPAVFSTSLQLTPFFLVVRLSFARRIQPLSTFTSAALHIIEFNGIRLM